MSFDNTSELLVNAVVEPSRSVISGDVRVLDDYLGLSVRLTRDFTMPGLILSARAPFSDIANDFSLTRLCSFLVS